MSTPAAAQESSRNAIVAVAATSLAAALAAGLCRIADLDFWWHLKTGELIARTGRVPREDVFSFTARGFEYIDHEWLFQLSQHVIFQAFGPAGIAVVKSLVIAATLMLIGWFSLRRGTGVAAACGLVCLAVAGGITRLIERPEIFTVLFAAITYVLLDEYVREGHRRLLIPIPLLAALWANVHAAVIVGIVIQCLFAAAMLIENRQRLWPVAATGAASALASLANPFGYRVLTVPFELTRIIASGVINNEEWRRPTLAKTPFFFLCAVIVGVLLVRAASSGRWRSVLVGVFLLYISLRYIRNVSLFSTFMPLLIAPEIAGWARTGKRTLLAVGAASLLFVLTVYYPFQRGFGVASYFPVAMADFIESHDLRGNMMNSYGLGGYLIWALAPERPVFVDGRNEVYLPLLQRLASAQADSRAWTALLRDYRIEYAVVDYVDRLDRVTTIGTDGSTTTTLAPLTATRFPRSRWALVHFDDVGMILIRREGVNARLAAMDYDAVFPEGWGYQRYLVESGAVDRERAITQLRRKLEEDPASSRARRLLQSLTQKR